MYESSVDFNLTDVEKNRFKEMEFFHMFETLKKLMGYSMSKTLMFKMLDIPYEHQDNVNKLLGIKTYFPTKGEIIIYERSKGTSYIEINKKYNISPITIAKYQKKFLEEGRFVFPKTEMHHWGVLDNLHEVKETFKKVAEKL